MKIGEAIAALVWLALMVFALYLLGWSVNLWAALGWQSWSL